MDGVHGISCEHRKWDKDMVVCHLLEGTWDQLRVTFVLILQCPIHLEHRANIRKIDVIWLCYSQGSMVSRHISVCQLELLIDRPGWDWEGEELWGCKPGLEVLTGRELELGVGETSWGASGVGEDVQGWVNGCMKEDMCEGNTEMRPLVYKDTPRQGRAEQIWHTDTVSSIAYTWK